MDVEGVVRIVTQWEGTLEAEAQIAEADGVENGVQEFLQQLYSVALPDYKDRPKDSVSPALMESVAGCILSRILGLALFPRLMQR